MATNNCANNWHDVRGPQKTFFIRNFGGGSVMVWAAISSRGSSELVFLEGKQNSLKYVETLDQYLFPLCDKFGDDAVIFQHDNAPLHTSRLTKTFLQKRNLKEQQKKDEASFDHSRLTWQWVVRRRCERRRLSTTRRGTEKEEPKLRCYHHINTDTLKKGELGEDWDSFMGNIQCHC